MNSYTQLEKIFEKLAHLNHLHAITSWDEAVMMPMGGGNARAKALATLDTISHETLTKPMVDELIQKAKNETLDPWQKANLEWMEMKYLRANCIPSDLVKKLTESSITCEQAWRGLRSENNWSDFAPLLANTLSLVKEKAQIQADVFKKSTYDVLLDEYSPDVNQNLIDPIFQQLKTLLPDLIQQIMHKQQNEEIVVPQGNFQLEKQRQLGLELMKALGFDFNHGRLDVSHHPFCGGVPEDVRITTRYNENEFLSSAMAICHETGHARYEQGLPVAWIDQPVGHALGMAVHESQSLLVEMQACRSFEFMQFLSPLLQKQFGTNTAFSPQNLHRLYTQVKPSLIRVDADEVTYPLHVIMRYEIEKELIEGKLKVNDLPDVWHEMMTKYLGLSTSHNFKDGVMQDVHWPSGSFGYFPAYTLGSLIAAQLFATAKKTHPEILTEISQGHFTTLFAWLNKHIHAKASSLKFPQLLMEATGQPLKTEFFVEHVKERYLKNAS